MKKLLFASALCATAALFADVNSYTGFESFPTDGTTPLGGNNDQGEQSSPIYFVYEADNQSEDASTVKAFGVDENLPAFSYSALCGVPNFFKADQANNRYLDLSTEGGTLWRNLYADGSTTAWDYGQDGAIYFDTMVQFTPTEDGDTPNVTSDDKLAIWLNVDEDGHTNLCAWAAVYNTDNTAYATNFILQTASPVEAGQWYRLTVEAIADVAGGEGVPGFKIYLDGQLLGSDKQAVTWEVGMEPSSDPEFLKDVVTNKVVFCALPVVGGSTDALISSVGFKGSGKLDDLTFGQEVPDFLVGGGSSIDFTLTWDANVSAVSYTIAGTTTSIDDLTSGTTTIQVEPNTVVTVAATPAAWYTVSGTGDVTVDAAKTQAITTALAATPDAAGATGLPASVTTTAAKTWADAKNITPAQIAASSYATESYLLNTELLNAAPALKIESITEVATGWQITIKAYKDATDDTSGTTLEGINGTLKVKAATDLADLATAPEATYTVTFDAAGVATATVTAGGNFMKATVE